MKKLSILLLLFSMFAHSNLKAQTQSLSEVPILRVESDTPITENASERQNYELVRRTVYDQELADLEGQIDEPLVGNAQELQSEADQVDKTKVRFKDPFSDEMISPQKFAQIIDSDVDLDASWKLREGLEQEYSRNYKGQNASLINWETNRPLEWLNYDRWLAQNKIKDTQGSWKIKLQDSLLRERIGKVLSCVGECMIYRGRSKVNANYLSNIREGDEVQTANDSYAWIFFLDGSMVRVSPNSSISFNEFNTSAKKNFHYARLNKGHVLWLSRQSYALKQQKMQDTDSIFLPLRLGEANIESFIRDQYQSLSESEKKMAVLNPPDLSPLWFTIINATIETNNKLGQKDTELLLVTPNASLITTNAMLDVFYELGNHTLFKARAAHPVYQVEEDDYTPDLLLGLRGYNNKKIQRFDLDTWYEVAAEGREFTDYDVDENPHLKRYELLTKRLSTILYARELWVSMYSKNIFSNTVTPEILAVQDGMRLWNVASAAEGENFELEAHKRYLIEYTRRTETTNIRSLYKLLDQQEAESGEIKVVDFGERHYQKAFDNYTKSIGMQYTERMDGVKDYNKLMYYVWTLVNAKGNY